MMKTIKECIRAPGMERFPATVGVITNSESEGFSNLVGDNTNKGIHTIAQINSNSVLHKINH